MKNMSDTIDYVCACVRYNPFATETCDAVVCYSSFPHFQNKPGALLEIKRVLKKGGRVFVCHTSSRAQINGVHHQVAELRHDLIPAQDEMRSLLTDAGYDDITVEETDESYFASGRKPGISQ
jgi:ubiquinone/menaquinone biosynthesis C-methylase UbiE